MAHISSQREAYFSISRRYWELFLFNFAHRDETRISGTQSQASRQDREFFLQSQASRRDRDSYFFILDYETRHEIEIKTVLRNLLCLSQLDWYIPKKRAVKFLTFIRIKTFSFKENLIEVFRGKNENSRDPEFLLNPGAYRRVLCGLDIL